MPDLQPWATAGGPNTEYRWEDIPPDTPKAILDAMGGPDANRVPEGEEPVRVVRAGVPVPWQHRGQLILEDGTPLDIRGSLPPDLPLGYHDFSPEHGRWKTRVIVTPEQCPLPPARQWGWAVQLYSLRSSLSWGMGDLADLRRLAEWSAGLGAGYLQVNPLSAVAPVLPQAASPYYPSSRRYRNPLYLRIEEVPGAERLGEDLERLAAAGRAMNSEPHLDRDRVFRLKQAALRAIWGGFSTDPALDRFHQEQGDALRQFATYCALAERFGTDWRRWPVEYRRPDGPSVRTFVAEHAADIAYHQWLQWLLDGQLAAATQHLPVLQDLPIGIDPGGADAWAWQDLLARDIAIGAPPDAFNSAGQDWQLPPLVPARLRAAGDEPFVQTIRAALRHAGGLRIDHVMGLFRLWWIPDGQPPSRGMYIRYPADDLLGIVALESHRAGAFVVGEDLGTVEPGVRQRLAQRRVLSVRLLWFEETPPREYPCLSMGAVTTHDLPTIAGLWTGADLKSQEAIGLPQNGETEKLRLQLRKMLGVADDAPADQVIEKAYSRLAEAPSVVLSATLEDAQMVEQRPNMPGTTDQWPNWCIGLPQSLDTMESAELPRRIAHVLNGGAGRAAAVLKRLEGSR